MSDAAAVRPVARRLAAEGVVVLAIAAWWLTSQALPEAVFPSPVGIATELVALAGSGEFWWDALISASRIVSAVVLATLFGTMIGMLPRYVPVLRGIVEDVLIPFFSSFPGLAWAILGTVWFGITPTAILIIQMLIIVPFCMVNVAEGAKEIGAEEVEMGRSFGRSRWALFWRVELPLVSPFIMASIRISYGICWKISLIAELFGARSGLGHLMHAAQEMGQVDTIIAICLAIVVFVWVGGVLVIDPLSRLLDATARAARPLRIRPTPPKFGSPDEIIVDPVFGAAPTILYFIGARLADEAEAEAPKADRKR